MSITAIGSSTQQHPMSQAARLDRKEAAEKPLENSEKADSEKRAAGKPDPSAKEQPSAPRYDQYIHTDDIAAPKPDGPQPSDKAPKAAPDDSPQKPADEDPDSKPMKCTVNTDRVDQEIRKLKEEQEKLQQQLRQAGDDPEKRARLEARLSSVNSELSAKDNDTYRRQQASFTYGGEE